MTNQQIANLLQQVIEKYNAILENAKTIDDFVEQMSLNPESYLMIRIGGETKKIKAQKILDAIQIVSLNELLSIGEITVDGNDVIIPGGAQWKINGVTYFTSSDTVINVPYCEAGKTRIDIVVATVEGTLVKYSGFETEGVAVRPNLPLNTVLVTEITVTDDSFNTVPTPILTADELAAIQGANSPSADNVFATIADIVSGTTPSLPQVLAQGDEAISDDGLKKIQIDRESSSVKIYTRPTTGDAWVLKGEYAYNGATITDGTDTNTITANDVSITDGVNSVVLTKFNILFNDGVTGAYYGREFVEITDGVNGSTLEPTGLAVGTAAYRVDKITNNGVDYPLPTGASSPIATVAQIPTINENYKGTYTSLSALETAHPTASSGNYAIVDAGAGNDAIQYIWDAQDGWVSAGTSSLSTTDALTEGTINLYFTLARVLATALTGISFTDGSDVTSANNVLEAIGKLQKQLTDVRAAKQDKRSYMSQSSPRFLDNTTALQKIFNVGSSGNGSMPVTSGRKYRVKGWAVFSALSLSSKTISFGLLGTATGSYTSGISLGAVSAALANTQIFNVGSFNAVQVAGPSFSPQARILIDLEFNCNGSGVIIPSVLFSVSQANMQVDSAYFERFDIGEASSNSTSDII